MRHQVLVVAEAEEDIFDIAGDPGASSTPVTETDSQPKPTMPYPTSAEANCLRW